MVIKVDLVSVLCYNSISIMKDEVLKTNFNIPGVYVKTAGEVRME